MFNFTYCFTMFISTTLQVSLIIVLALAAVVAASNNYKQEPKYSAYKDNYEYVSDLVCPSISYFSKAYCKVYLFIRPQRNTTTITTLRTITFTLTLAPRRTARETIPTDLTTLFSPTVAVKLSNTTSMATPVTSLTSLTRVRPSMPTITNQRNITLT